MCFHVWPEMASQPSLHPRHSLARLRQLLLAIVLVSRLFGCPLLVQANVARMCQARLTVLLSWA